MLNLSARNDRCFGLGRSLGPSAVDVFAFVTPVLGDPLRADRAQLIVVGPCAAHDPRQGGGDDDSDTATHDQYRCEHGAVSIWRTREDFKLWKRAAERPPVRLGESSNECA